jgi:hypothetical protein
MVCGLPVLAYKAITSISNTAKKKGGNPTYLKTPPIHPLHILPAKLVSSLATFPFPNSPTLPLRILDGDINPVLCNACPALRPGDLILPIGLMVTDKLERRFRRRGRSSVVFVFVFVWVSKRLFPEGPGETCIALEEKFCVGVGVRKRSIGSPGVVGVNMGVSAGVGVCALELHRPWWGARRPDEKRLEYAGIVRG